MKGINAVKEIVMQCACYYLEREVLYYFVLAYWTFNFLLANFDKKVPTLVVDDFL